MPSERRFTTQDQCRVALTQIYRELRADSLEREKARVLIHCVLSISTILKTNDMETRLTKLEERIQERREELAHRRTA